MPAGAARNAVDCALWDLEAKLSGIRVSQTSSACSRRSRSRPPTRCRSATPEAMAAQARANAARPLLKVKIGGDGDIARIRAVVEAAPDSRIILDANEGWTEHNLARKPGRLPPNSASR